MTIGAFFTVGALLGAMTAYHQRTATSIKSRVSLGKLRKLLVMVFTVGYSAILILCLKAFQKGSENRDGDVLLLHDTNIVFTSGAHTFVMFIAGVVMVFIIGTVLYFARFTLDLRKRNVPVMLRVCIEWCCEALASQQHFPWCRRILFIYMPRTALQSLRHNNPMIRLAYGALYDAYSPLPFCGTIFVD